MAAEILVSHNILLSGISVLAQPPVGLFLLLLTYAQLLFTSIIILIKANSDIGMNFLMMNQGHIYVKK